MGANIYYEPVERKRYDVDTGMPSSFRQSLEKVFGSFPCTLAEKDIPQLRAMAAMIETSYEHNPYETLVDGIEKLGAIRVWAEY